MKRKWIIAGRLLCGILCMANANMTITIQADKPGAQISPTTWGAKRAAMGHPKPFNMKYLGIGNEQWGPQYIERYKVFVKAIKEKYPDIKLIGTAGKIILKVVNAGPQPVTAKLNILSSRIH